MIWGESTLRVWKERRNIFAVAAIVALLEGLFRIGSLLPLGQIVRNDPELFGAVILLPPVTTVFGLAVAVSVRDGIDRNWIRREDDDTTRVEATAPLLKRGLTLASIALVGHGFAIVAGSALFLLADTPIRYVLYWMGYGDLFTFRVVAYSPIAGIAIGTALAWAVPGIAVVTIANGANVGTALRETIAAPVSRPRLLARVMAGHLAFVAFVGAVVLCSYRTMEWMAGAGFEGLTIVPMALGGLLLVFGAAVWLSETLAFMIDRLAGSMRSTTGDGRYRRPVPVARLAVAVMLVTALVTAAGVVRVNETRPMDTSPDPLSDDPDELYRAAVENTDRASHEHRVLNASDGELIGELRIDREDRELVVSLSDEDTGTYHSYGVSHMYTGILGGREPIPLPLYAKVTEDELGRLGEPNTEVENWTVVAEDEDEITLELTDPDDVTYANYGTELEDLAEDPEVHESWIRMTVDKDRKTLSHGETRLNVSDQEFSVDFHFSYEYETDIDVDRPSQLGSPGPEELFWRLFAY